MYIKTQWELYFITQIMKIINPSYKIINQGNTLEDIYRHIEFCGRICYKSEDRITEDSYKRFLSIIKNNKHNSVLEHGTVYLDFTGDSIISALERYKWNAYSKMYRNTLEDNWKEPHLYVTTNYRVIIENDWEEDLKYLCVPTKFHEKRVSVHFICDRAIANEFTRHRRFSFSQESTRYCNYDKNKFGRELTFIKPLWLQINEEGNVDLAAQVFIEGLRYLESDYFRLLYHGWKPEQARNILPLTLKTELIMTGFISDWEHFFELRCAKDAHPQARELSVPLEQELKSKC